MAHYDGSYKNDTVDIQSTSTIIIDVLGGWSMTMEEGLRKLLGKKTKDVLRNAQKSVVSYV